MTDHDVGIAVVGLVGGECFGRAARAAIDGATVIVGSARQLQLVDPPTTAARVALGADLPGVFDEIERGRDAGARICVLASGDPGFFGIVRALSLHFGSAALRVHPAPSSVALAFARLGDTWDDALVVSAHGRSLGDAIDRLLAADKVAVFTAPDSPPQAVGAALLARDRSPRSVAVLTRLGEPDEAVVECDLERLAAGTFDPMSIVVLRREQAAARTASLTWGLETEKFAHRAGMITKAEVRAVALGKLALPPRGVLWDVGAGSGSVAIEVARLCPELRVIAIESDADSVDRIVANALAHGVAVEAVHGRAPEAFATLPDPDRVFVGGGGIAVLDAARQRLTPGGTIVANYALIDRAVAAWQRLGDVVQLSVSRGTPVAEQGVRLTAENPVFVCWGSP